MVEIHLTQDLSMYPLLIHMIVEETNHELAIGSGFVYEHEDFYYLITNGHNVTGVNPETNQRLSAHHVAFPTGIRTRVKQQLSENINAFAVVPDQRVTIDIYSDEEHTQPLWYIHPEHGYKVDVVAIPICPKADVPESVLVYPINKYPDFTIEPEVSDDVYVLGYPFGITDSLQLPIWKRGSIATEPAIPFQGLPKMLIDTASRSGMSGAPVILKRSGIHHMNGGVMTEETFFGTAFGFVGIYSGRIGANDATGAQLGIVWRKSVIDEILVGKSIGTTEFQTI